MSEIQVVAQKWGYLDGTGCSKHGIQLTLVLQRQETRAIVAASDELTIDPDGGYRGSANELAKLRADSLSFRDLVELNNRIFCLLRIKAGLCLDAKGSFHEGKHQHGLSFHEPNQFGPDCRLIIWPGQEFDHSLFPFSQGRVCQHILDRVGDIRIPNFRGITRVANHLLKAWTRGRGEASCDRR